MKLIYLSILKKLSVVIVFLMLTGCASENILEGGIDSKAKIKDGISYLKDNDYEDASVEFNKILTYNLQNSEVQFLNALTYHLAA
jgi:Tfp pilus assembly protein PilF